MRDPFVPSSRLDAFEASALRYLLFNAERSLREHAHALESATFGGLLAHRDRTRPSGSYYNRIDGLDEPTVGALEGALEWFDDAGLEPRLELAAERATTALCAHLIDLDFVPGAGTVVLAARPGEVVAAPVGAPACRRLEA
jgi:hypothetical protein